MHGIRGEGDTDWVFIFADTEQSMEFIQVLYRKGLHMKK